MLEELSVSVTVSYSEQSCAAGALLVLVFMDSGTVDFTKTAFLALSRNTSLQHTLSFQLPPGQYGVLVYDIESDGTLASGVGYPAVESELIINETTQGSKLAAGKRERC